MRGPRLLAFCHFKKRGQPRLGLSVAKRHVRRATLRNRVRRVLREHFRQVMRPKLPPMDAVVSVVGEIQRGQVRAARDELERVVAYARL